MRAKLLLLGITILGAPARGQLTQRASVGTGGVEANSDSFESAMSADGRIVVFDSAASNLVAGDTNGRWDIFLRDRAGGVTTRVSLDSSGAELQANNYRPSVSGDGTVIAFESWTQPFPGDNVWGILVRDLASGTTTQIASGLHGVPAPTLSTNGRYVAYSTGLTIFDVGTQVWVHDRQTGALAQASLDTTGGQPDASSSQASISADGRLVAFSSPATDLVAGDANGHADIFVRDLVLGTTELVSVSSSGRQGNQDSWRPSISDDGRFVAFDSVASNLAPGDANARTDVFLRDRHLGVTTRITDAPGGIQNDTTAGMPRISGDGRFVAFQAVASDIVPGDTNGVSDVFVHDIATGTTVRASVDSSGAEANAQCAVGAISADGSEIAFASSASNLAPGDGNAAYDIFVRDVAPGCPPASSYCTAIANSTGQAAQIDSTGWGSFAENNFVLLCSGLPATANGRFFFGIVPIDPGVPFGNGVRCVGGTLRRLPAATATGGTVAQPQNLSSSPYAGIPSGASRYFTFWYRDPAAGGSAFNASTGLAVTFCD